MAETATLTLTEFLRARYDEDEAPTFELVPCDCPPECCAPEGWVGHRCLICGTPAEFGGAVDAITEISLEHEEQVHGRSRVLADIKAKRQIVDEHRMVTFTDTALGFVNEPVCATCHGMYVGPYDDEDWLDTHEPVSLQQPFPCRTLRALASIYADHPDYSDEWRS